MVIADTPLLLAQVYQLRYQVYCREHPFENPADHLAGYETDEYDAHAVHAALLQPCGQVCGCVRLIVPAANSVLPITRLLPRDQACLPIRTAEVSRYAITKALRHDGTVSAALTGRENRSQSSVPLAMGLMLAVAALSQRAGISHLAAVMTPALRRLLRGSGMKFTPIGPLVEYHGRRQPCIAAIEDLFSQVKTALPASFAIIQEGIGGLSGHSALRAPALVGGPPVAQAGVSVAATKWLAGGRYD